VNGGISQPGCWSDSSKLVTYFIHEIWWKCSWSVWCVRNGQKSSSNISKHTYITFLKDRTRPNRIATLRWIQAAFLNASSNVQETILSLPQPPNCYFRRWRQGYLRIVVLLKTFSLCLTKYYVIKTYPSLN
jgi:hypothetical protein